MGASSRSINHAARKTKRLAKRSVVLEKCRQLAVQKKLPTGLAVFLAEERIIGVEPFDRCVTKLQPAVLPLARHFPRNRGIPFQYAVSPTVDNLSVGIRLGDLPLGQEVSPFALEVEFDLKTNFGPKIGKHWEIPLPHLFRFGDRLRSCIDRYREGNFNLNRFVRLHTVSVKRFPILDGCLRFLKLFFQSLDQLRMTCCEVFLFAHIRGQIEQ